MPIPLDTPPMPQEGRPIPPALNLRCVTCGYSLTGLITRVCPECGTPFDPLETYQANIKNTWEFHFAYRRPIRSYVLLVLAALPIPAGLITAGVVSGFSLYIGPWFWILTAILSVIVQVVCLCHDWYGPWKWIAIGYGAVLCAIYAGR